MAQDIKMPQLSDTMDSGKILVWHKKVGDKIERGDILAEVETDKANLEIESFHPGVLLKIITDQDQVAVVGEPIAVIGKAGEKLEDSAPAKSASKPVAKEAAPAKPSTSQPSTPAPQQTNNIVSNTTTTNSGRIKASPLAKKIATDNNLDLSKINGSGPGGRIVKKDVQGASSQPSQQKLLTERENTGQNLPITTQPIAHAEGGTLEPLTKMRSTIAKRMQQSVNESPHFYVTTSINMSACLSLRAQLKAQPKYEKVSINHLIIKATALGIKAEPRVNWALKNDQLYKPNGINIGIVTALEEGLMIPVIKSCDKLPLQDLAFEARAAIDRARAGRPTAQDLSGGTFSISNMGMFDVDNFTAIINPGQGAILAVSSTKEKPIVVNGRIEVAPMMNVMLSVDHRIIDGMMAGNFLKAFKNALENPALLCID